MPDWKRIIRERMARLNLEGAAEADRIEEFAGHLEDRYRELLSAGADEPRAYRETIAELEDLYPLRQSTAALPRASERAVAGEQRGGTWLYDLGRDIRFAARGMRKSPLFVLFVVLTLALGIGANATVFTVINTLLLNPLPVPKASSLIAVAQQRARDRSQARTALPLSYPDFVDIQTKNTVFASLAGYSSAQVLTFQEHGDSERLFCELVTGNYFATLGLNPARGRFFLPEEDGVPGEHPVAVINYGTWQSRFGGDPQIIGKGIRINGLVFHVIGVAPPRFIGINAIFGPDLWIPAAMMEQLFPNQLQGALHDRNKTIFLGAGRLKTGISVAQAQANLSALAADLAREYPGTNEGRGVMVLPVRDILFGNSMQTTSGVMMASAGLLAVVAIVLLIACSNVANLLLARAAGRQQEIAVRLALGASRVRLVRQLLTESVILGLLSGAAGLAVAVGGLRLLFSSLPSSSNFITPKLDLTVFAFALLVSIATGLLFGTIPALKASRTDVADSLKEESRSVGRSRAKVNIAKVLLVAQVAFSFLLLVIAALFLRSIGHAYAMDPGFQTAHLDVFMTTPGQAGYNETRAKAYFKEARERIERLPGVAALAWSSNLPLWARPMSGIEVAGREKRSRADQLSAIVNTIEPDFFDASGTRLISGRAFYESDQKNTLPVAIVNEKFARDFWPNGDAIGKRIQLPGEKMERQIVGIARNASYTNWAEPPQLCVKLCACLYGSASPTRASVASLRKWARTLSRISMIHSKRRLRRR